MKTYFLNNNLLASILVVPIVLVTFFAFIAPHDVALLLLVLGLCGIIAALVWLKRCGAFSSALSPQCRKKLQLPIVFLLLSTALIFVVLLFNSSIGIWKPMPLRWEGGGKIEIIKRTEGSDP